MHLFRSVKKPSLLGTSAFKEAQPTAAQREKIFEAQKEYHRIYNHWRDFDFLTTCFAIVGLFLSIINYEHIVQNTDRIDYLKHPDPM